MNQQPAQSAIPPGPLPVNAAWQHLYVASGPFGDGSRSSRSPALPRPLTQLTKVADLAPVASSAPVYVAPRPDNSEVVVVFDHSYQRFSPSGAPVGRGESGSVVAFADSIAADGEEVAQGSRRYRPDVGYGEMFALARGPGLFVSVFHLTSLRAPHSAPTAAGVRLEVQSQRAAGERHEMVLTHTLDGDGGGAIGPDGRAVLFSRAGKVVSFSFASTPAGAREVDTQLALSPVDLSITSAGWAFVAAATPDGKSAVTVVSPAGRVLWTATAPFVAAGPPIDGGAGRLYLAGGGLAALEAGRVLWASASATPVRAVAFSDGSLAMTVGAELRLVSREGALRATLRAPDGATFSGRPGIGPDGAVWVASASALYVAK